jgi:adenylate kinase
MKRIIVITGTPGVGKTRLVNTIKKRMKGVSVYNATDLVNKHKLYSHRDKFGTKVVKLGQLQELINGIAREDKNRLIIFEGHVLCDIKIRGARAIVIRAHLRTLLERLKARGYPVEKIKDNIVSEATDYCGAKALRNYGEVHEILNSGGKVVSDVVSIIKGSSTKNRKQINLLNELLEMIRKDKRFVV